MGLLSGRVAVVTGATTGVGLAIARTLAGAGASLTIAGPGSSKDTERVRTELAEEFGVDVFFSAVDMRHGGEVSALVQNAVAAFDSVDVLVNTTGPHPTGPVEDYAAERWDFAVATTLSAAFHTIRRAIPEMRKRRWGRIVNIASPLSSVGFPARAAQAAAEHGLVGLTRSVALEVATIGITVNCISVGQVWTPHAEKQVPATMKARWMSEEQVKSEMLAPQPTRQFVSVEQVAALTLFLCTDAAAQITGANLAVDGGWTAQ